MNGSTTTVEQLTPATPARTKTTERLLTLKEIQDAAGVSRPTLYRWRHEHGLKMVRVGGCVRVRESDWLAWLEKHSTSGNGDGEGSAAP
jgi:excisionase family DNA binding protein